MEAIDNVLEVIQDFQCATGKDPVWIEIGRTAYLDLMVDVLNNAWPPGHHPLAKSDPGFHPVVHDIHIAEIPIKLAHYLPESAIVPVEKENNAAHDIHAPGR